MSRNAIQYLRDKGVSDYLNVEFTSAEGEKTEPKWLVTSNQNHMASWKERCHKNDLLRSELLTPAVVFSANQSEFSFLQQSTNLVDVEVQSGFEKLGPWCYHVETQGGSTRPFGTYNDRTIDFHRFRNSLICGAVHRYFGSRLNDIDLADIGCNCGFFSLEMANRGAKHCLGIDLRDFNIAQAKWLGSLYGIDNAEFRVGNVKDLGNEQFDVVLNLGLMYHLSTPFEVLQACYRMTKEVCVIDSICHTEPFSGYHVVCDKNIHSPIEGDLSFELQPTYRGLLDTIFSVGFSHVVELIGLSSQGIELYDDLSRRCFFAFKSAPNMDALKRIAEE
jgi:tRNA (mo5U34)-methyltransferase